MWGKQLLVDGKPTLEQQVIVAIVDAVEKIGADSVPVLLADFSDPRVRKLATIALGETKGIPEASVSVLVRLLQDKDEDIQGSAILILGSAISEKEHLAKLLHKTVTADRKAIIDVLIQWQLRGYQAADAALQAIKPTAEETLPGYIDGLKSDWGRAKRRAVRELAVLGPKAKAAVPVLLQALKEPITEGDDGWQSEDVRKTRLAIVDALRKIGLEKKELSASMIALMEKNQDAVLQKELLSQLRKVEDDPQRIVSLIAKFLPVMRPKYYQIIGVGKMDLRGSYQELHHEAFLVLENFGAEARHAVPVLIKVYKEFCYEDEYYPDADDAMRTRRQLITTLGKIGPDAKDALPILNEALQSENAQLRQAAVEAIRAITQGQPKELRK